MQWKKSVKNGSKINPKSIKNWPNIDQTSPEMEVWRRLGGVLEASWGVLGRLGSILGCLGRFRAVLRASWEYLDPSGRRLGVVLEASWSRLGTSWSVLGPLGASCGRLGSVLEVSCVWFSSQSRLNLGMLSWMSFCNWFLMDFASKNRCPNYEKSLNSIGKIGIFCFRAVLT